MNRLESDLQMIHLKVDKPSAWLLLSTLQLASDHPAKSPSVELAVQVAKRLEPTLVGNDEVLQEIARANLERREPNLPIELTKAAFAAQQGNIILEINKYEAWCLVGVIQMVHRHLNFKSSPAAQATRRLADQITSAIADYDVLSQVLQAGWDESLDIKVNPQTSNQPVIAEIVEVHNAWTVYGLDEDGKKPFATFSRPQDWGDRSRWHYEKFRFEWVTEGKHYINHVHCWTDIKEPKQGYPALFAPLIVQILMPSRDPRLCGQSYLDEEDFWDEAWGEMPPIVELEEYF